MTMIATNPLDAIPIGTGTWQWGDTIWWNYSDEASADDARAAFHASLDAGITLFDTAEIYGQGKSETLIGQFLAEQPEGAKRLYIATKFAPLPYRLTPTQFRGALERSLVRLRLPTVDLYQVHWSFFLSPERMWSNALADALDSGSIRAAGVSNYNGNQTRRAHRVLESREHRLTSNQVEYSLLNRLIENPHEGTLKTCNELGVKVIAYSPLAQGLLTGKYTVDNPPPGLRKFKYRNLLKAIPPLIALMTRLGEKYAVDGIAKTPAQVALNWCIVKGTLPIPGAKNARQVAANAGAVGWRLSDDDMAALDEMSDTVLM